MCRWLDNGSVVGQCANVQVSQQSRRKRHGEATHVVGLCFFVVLALVRRAAGPVGGEKRNNKLRDRFCFSGAHPIRGNTVVNV